MGYFKKIFLCLLFWGMVFQNGFALNPLGVVNVLTWWNYLNSPEIATLVKNKCGVDLYYDEYYCNSEFLKRFATSKSFYDIIIFPQTVYGMIKDNIEINNSSLSSITKGYDVCVRGQYLSHHYSKNIVFFVLSLTGFIWNPQKISLSVDDTAFSMFKKAKDGIVIMVNDPVSVEYLVNGPVFNRRLSKLTERDVVEYGKETVFKQIAQDTTVYITNGYNRLYDDDKFVFAFQRSGDAIFTIKTTKKALNFLVHPDFSYVSPDLLAELNTRSETQCVARVLASREVVAMVQKKSYYFSPYSEYQLVNDRIFQTVYKQFQDICKVKWLGTIAVDIYKAWLKKWDDIAILPQILKSNTTFPRSQF